MNIPFEYLIPAFLMGFLGSGHCVAMCGSLSMALGFSVPNDKPFLLYSIMISFGRIFGYGLIGFTVNFFAQSVVSLTQGGVLYLAFLSSILMFGIGLHIANISSVVLKTEFIGKWFQPLIDPIKAKILPIDSLIKCILYGFFWGFLPCGLVYTALSLALTSPSSVTGFLVMLFFGLGTLPTLVGLTLVNAKLNLILNRSYVRVLLGVSVMLMALWQFYIAYNRITLY
jgi:sulfite exporter TauE/SafE